MQRSRIQALLKATGALLTWKPGERYVLITTSAPVVVSFALGDRRYDVGPITLEAAFAPFARGDEAYLPLDDVLRSLDLALRRDGAGRGAAAATRRARRAPRRQPHDAAGPWRRAAASAGRA